MVSYDWQAAVISQQYFNDNCLNTNTPSNSDILDPAQNRSLISAIAKKFLSLRKELQENCKGKAF